MVLESRLDVACSSISAGETNASIDWYFTVVTLGERKGMCGGEMERENDYYIHHFSTKNAKDAFQWLHHRLWIPTR